MRTSRRSRLARFASGGAVSVLFVVAGCGGDDGPAATAAVEETTTTEPATTAVEETTSTVEVTTTTVEETTTTAVPAPTLEDLIARGGVNIAHTGGELEAPDETMFAFRTALANGADVLDMNAMLSKDGQIVLMHNPTVDSRTNTTGNVVDMTAAELSALDAAYWFVPGVGRPHDRPEADYVYRGVRTGAKPPPDGFTADDFGVATLEQVFEAFPDAVFGVEMEEEAGLGIVPVLAALIEQYGVQDRIVVSSMGDQFVTEFMKLMPDVAVSPGITTMTTWYAGDQGPLPGYRLLQLPPKFGEIEVLTPELIANATAADLPIWVWANEDSQETEATYRMWVDMGINGVNADRPSVMAAVEAG